MAARTLLCSLLFLMAACSIAEQVNTTASDGMVWSTATEEQELVDNPGDVIGDQDQNQLDGGFSSLDGMLQWAIGHSDPEKLKKAAQDTQRRLLSPEDLQRRQLELKELLDKVKMPSDAQLMQIAIADLKNASLSLEDRHRALQELLVLVEPIDNANDLGKLGGLNAVIGELNHSDPDVRRLSAWVLGKASQNNPYAQKQVLELGALSTLLKMVNSSFVEEAVKALYAVSALIRNNVAGQDMFCAEDGHKMLQAVMSNSSVDIRLRRKAVFLVGDMAECQMENTENPELLFLSDKLFVNSVVDLIASVDLDLQEKALVAIKNLLQLKTAEPLIFRGFCGLEVALVRMKQKLQELMVDEYQRDYATDVESLRGEVELTFRRKLELVKGVSR